MSREQRDEQEAADRTERAKNYATKFPQFSGLNDPWCTIEWQQNLISSFKERNAPPKD